MLSNFIKAISSIKPLQPETIEHISKVLQISRVAKGSILLSEGQVSQNLYFLCSGMARAYYWENEEEITSWIVAENDFIYSTSSFIQQKPSFETIQVLEDSLIISITYADLQNLTFR